MRRQVKAGIMLYALLLSVVFGMVLSFYLTAIVDNQRNLISQKQFLTAQLMAKMTQQVVKNESGQIRFNQGISSYQTTQNTIKITVQLENAVAYRFEFSNMVK
ncbi:competence type IV pilus minor pilin ComGG [Pseudolactococcus insecticola]|nr:competence type IV pilus minor pilin ComGG [Lactococcus insecticola]